MKAKSYLLHNGSLYRRTVKGLRYIPDEDKRLSIMKGLHDEIGHWDFATTYEIISGRFWWPKIRPDVAHFVRSCDVCQKVNPSEQHRPFGKIPVSGLFHTWSVDFAGPLPQTSAGNRYILIAVEHLSGWPVAQAIPPSAFNSGGVIRFVEEQICTPYGNPVVIVSDGDQKFDSIAVQTYARESAIVWVTISAYNPRGNAKVERMIGTMKRAIKKIIIMTNEK